MHDVQDRDQLIIYRDKEEESKENAEKDSKKDVQIDIYKNEIFGVQGEKSP